MGNGVKRLAVLLLVLVTAAALSASVLAGSSSVFTDVEPGDWYTDAVDYVVSNGLFNGTDEGVFSPDDAMTRGMFVTVLSRLAQADTAEVPDAGFSDVVPGEWYAGAVNWAALNEYAVECEDGRFRPDEPVTREEAADFLARYIIAGNVNTGTPEEITEAFADAESVSGWAADSVEFLRSSGLMNGDENGNFCPQKGLTRAEAAAVFTRVGRRTQAAQELDGAPTEAQPDADGHPSTEDFRGLYEYAKDDVRYRLVNNRMADYMTMPLSEWKANGQRPRMNCAEFVAYTYMYWLQEHLGYELDYAPTLSDLSSDSLHYSSAYGWLEWADEQDGWDRITYSGYSSLPKTRAMTEIKEDMDSGEIPVGSLVIFSAMSGEDNYKHIGIYAGKEEDGGYYILHCTKAGGVDGVMWETIDDIVNRPGASIRPCFAINIVFSEGD